MNMDTQTQDKPPRTLSFSIVPPEKLRESEAFVRWVYPLVEKACSFSDGRFEPMSVLEGCAGLNPDWHAQLWIAGYRGGGEAPSIEAVAVTTVSTYASGLKVLEVVLVAGENAKGWVTFEDEFVTWAQRQGCEKIQMIGRKGWQRQLGEAWRVAAWMMEREVPALAVQGEMGGAGNGR